MDNITDILTSFFVSSTQKNSHTKKNSNKHQQQTQNHLPRTKEHSKSTTANSTTSSSKSSLKKPSVNLTSSSQSSSPSTPSSSPSTRSSSPSISSTSISSSKNDSDVIEKVKVSTVKELDTNMMIVNQDINQSISTLREILHRLSMVKGINNIYKNNLTIVCSDNNRHLFKKLLIDNPYVYFYNFNVVFDLSKKDYDNLGMSFKRNVVVIESDLYEKVSNIINSIGEANVQYVLLTSSTVDMKKMFRLLGSKKVFVQ